VLLGSTRTEEDPSTSCTRPNADRKGVGDECGVEL
jgi:hypothetical protein